MPDISNDHFPDYLQVNLGETFRITSLNVIFRFAQISKLFQ